MSKEVENLLEEIQKIEFTDGDTICMSQYNRDLIGNYMKLNLYESTPEIKEDVFVKSVNGAKDFYVQYNTISKSITLEVDESLDNNIIYKK